MAKQTMKAIQGGLKSCLWWVSLLASLAFCSSEVLAQTPEASAAELLMEKLPGRWVMTGTIENQAIVHDVEVDRILKRQYVRIHEVSREKDAEGEHAYEAWVHIAWDKEKGEYAAMWLDNTGTTNFSADSVGHGRPEGNRIPFIWKSADGSGIRNTFIYDRPSDSWSWTIENVSLSGEVSTFAEVTLKRQEPK